MPKVFMSHSSQDDDTTLVLVEQLRRAGFDIWVDFENIRGGSDWLCELQAGIERCDALVVALSKAALKSVWMERECLFAFQLGKPVYTALVDDVRLPLHLINIQYCDCRADIAKGAAELAGALWNSLAGPTVPNYLSDEVSSRPIMANFLPYIGQLPGGDIAAEVARHLLDWAGRAADEIAFGGRTHPACHARLILRGRPLTLFTIWAYPKTPSLQLPFDQLAAHRPFKGKRARRALLKKLNRMLPRASRIPSDAIDRRPTLPLALFNADGTPAAFQAIMQEIIERLRQDA